VLIVRHNNVVSARKVPVPWSVMSPPSAVKRRASNCSKQSVIMIVDILDRKIKKGAYLQHSELESPLF
jgi:hypothetical protein